MWPHYPDLLEKPVPRYTSYPTAAEFRDGMGQTEMAEALEALPTGTDVSLYVHIPYCQAICWYCGCNTGAAGKRQRLSSYLEALEAEIALVAAQLGGRARVRRIAFGGGSPNAITPIDFVRLCDRITTIFRADCEEISVEIDPRIFTPEWSLTLSLCGVTRVSLGVQSFSDAIQKAIGRIQPEAQIRSCVDHLRKAGIGAINFDLMYGLPGQTLGDLEDTLDTAIDLQPSRIALFGYAHLPQVIPRQRKIDAAELPNPAKRFEMAALGCGRLTEAGYRAIGFDHFAQGHDALAKAADQRRVRRNFQGFTDDGCTVLVGLGASAISRFPDRILQNEKNPGRYRMLLSGGVLPAARGVFLTADDVCRGSIIENLLCNGAATNIPGSVLSMALPALSDFAARGLIAVGHGDVRISDHALPYARAIAAAFDTFRTVTTGTHSLAV